MFLIAYLQSRGKYNEVNCNGENNCPLKAWSALYSISHSKIILDLHQQQRSQAWEVFIKPGGIMNTAEKFVLDINQIFLLHCVMLLRPEILADISDEITHTFSFMTYNNAMVPSVSDIFFMAPYYILICRLQISQNFRKLEGFIFYYYFQFWLKYWLGFKNELLITQK